MSGIFGIYSFNAASPSREEIEPMKDALLFRGNDDSGILCDGPVGMGSTLLRTTPQSLQEHFPMRHAEAGLILTADARIDNRKELLTLLNLQDDCSDPITDGELILASYRKWGEACPEHLLGDFAFALWDSKEKKLFCARDHFGIRPFCYYEGMGRFHFASEVSALIALPGIPRKLEELYLRDYLCSNIEDKILTGFKNIFRLEPAHALVITEGGEKRTRCYWKLDAKKELPPASDEEYIEEFREKLFAAISRRLVSLTPVAAELSGGQDSSMIAAVAQKLLQTEGLSLKTFSHALPKGEEKTIDDMYESPQNSDERPLVELIIPWCGLAEHTYVTGENSPGFLELIRFTQQRRGYPLPNYGTLAFPLNRAVADSGCKVLLSGLGGDQCVTGFGNGYYAELYRNGCWQTIFKEAKGLRDIFGLPLYRVIVSHFIFQEHPALRLFLRKIFKGARGGQGLDFSRNLISPAFAKETDAFTMVRRIKQSYALGRGRLGTSFKEQQLVELEWGYLPNSAEERSGATLACGVECRFPLLDKELVEYVLALPSHMKVKDGWKRYIARKSMDGLLPPEVQWRKRKRGPGAIPYGFEPVFKDIDAIKKIIVSMKNDSFIMRYLGEKLLVESLEMAEQRKFGDKFQLRHLRVALAIELFLQTVER